MSAKTILENNLGDLGKSLHFLPSGGGIADTYDVYDYSYHSFKVQNLFDTTESASGSDV